MKAKQGTEKRVAGLNGWEEPIFLHLKESVGGVSELVHVSIGLEKSVENKGRGIAENVRVEQCIEELVREIDGGGGEDSAED